MSSNNFQAQGLCCRQQHRHVVLFMSQSLKAVDKRTSRYIVVENFYVF